jgi:hypothetical protein
VTGIRLDGPDGIMSARGLFLCGALTLPAFLFQQDLAVKAFQVLMMVALCFVFRRKIGIPILVVLCAGIVASNLLVPSGRLVWTVIGLRVTDAALRGGVSKATAIAGMIALSKLSIRPDLRLPGRFGGLIGRSLMYFESIMAHRDKIRRDAVVDSLDSVLENAYAAGEVDDSGAGTDIKTTPAGLACMFLFLLSNWAALGISIAYPALLWHR